ncbi:hypothetical protein SAMN04515674_110179 [Pseudarcicella hirudinis]|uniref:Uncharacterized protein n=1 Tax=Pseudarcicella hirudinis TaxID=1079859 RepID=A0A1I5W196_9BACT|nr:hypothetical protein SAMN04515674_110179 [Pseudarcicella hirudinis]
MYYARQRSLAVIVFPGKATAGCIENELKFNKNKK